MQSIYALVRSFVQERGCGGQSGVVEKHLIPFVDHDPVCRALNFAAVCAGA